MTETSPPAGVSPVRSLQAEGACRAVPGRPTSAELVSAIRRLADPDGPLVALFDAEAIAGERHLLSAWAHLGRSRREGAQRLRDRGAELALYVAGDDQLGRALAKVGVHEGTTQFVLLVERPRSLAEVREAFGLRPDPTAYPRPPTEATLERLGISAAEREIVPRSAWEALVLERVALVDLAPATGGGKG
ncbi:MAG: KEOPS complex subunit Cgi121 [Thermoplasmata archaeon]